MRTRAYRPEVSGCLEGRLLLSSVAGHTAAPYVFTGRQYKLYVVHESAAFSLFARSHDRVTLHNDLEDIYPLIPFARVDGLPARVDSIEQRMLKDIKANVPHAINIAARDVLAAVRAEVQARVQSGDVVVR